MATVNFSVPEQVKKHFNQAFAHQNKSQIIARLMEQAIEEQHLQLQRKRALLVLLKIRGEQKGKVITDAMARTAREEGRQ